MCLTSFVTKRDKREWHLQVAWTSQTTELASFSCSPLFSDKACHCIVFIPLSDIAVLTIFPIRKSCTFLLTALWKCKLFGNDHALQQIKRRKALTDVKNFRYFREKENVLDFE